MADHIKKILLVDDDATLLEYLVSSLSLYRSLRLLTALNGKEAVDVLDRETVDLVVTDIQMPEMDGIALVSHLLRHHPRIPVIIITGTATPSTTHKLGRMGIISFEKKPIDVDSLANRIFDLLMGVDSGYVQGISVPSFLQVLYADKKSCTLKVTDGNESGFLHMLNGQLVDAEFRDLKGIKAATAIIGWDAPVTIDLQQILRLKETTIEQDLTFLIMEAIRQKDEISGGRALEDRDAASDFVLPDHNSIPPSFLETNTRALCINNGMALPDEISDDDAVFFDGVLWRLVDVKGYKASALLTHTGRPLAVHAMQENTDIHFVAENVHNMFCSLQERASLLGMGPLEESVFRSRDGIVLIRCMAEEKVPHLHIMVILSHTEGEGLMRIRLKQTAEEAAAHFL